MREMKWLGTEGPGRGDEGRGPTARGEDGRQAQRPKEGWCQEGVKKVSRGPECQEGVMRVSES